MYSSVLSVEIPISDITITREQNWNVNTSLAAKGALAHRLQRRTACNAAPRASGPQMADGVWKGVYPWVLGTRVKSR